MKRPLPRLALLVYFLLSPALRGGEPLPETAKLLPAETSAYATVDCFEDFRLSFQKTPLYQMSRDAALKPFMDDVKKQFEAMLNKEESRLSELILKEKVLPEGRIVLASIRPATPAGSDKEPETQPLALIQWGRHTEAVKGAMEEDIRRQMRKGLQRKEESFRGIPVITVIKPAEPSQESLDIFPDFSADEEVPAYPGAAPEIFQRTAAQPATWHYCFVRDIQIISRDRGSLEFVIAHLQGAQGRTLYESKPALQAFRALDNRRPIEFYADTGGFAEKFSFLLSSSDESQAVKDPLGLESAQALLGVIQTAPSKTVSFDLKILLFAPAPRKGLLKAFEMDSAAPALPPFLDPQASRVYWINLDLNRAAGELFRALGSADPSIAAALNSPLLPPESPEGGMFTALDLVAALKGPIIVSEKITAASAGEDTFTEEPLFLIAVKEKETLASALAQLHAHFIEPQRPNSRREYQGYPLYVIPAPSFTAEGDDGEVPTATKSDNFAWCVTESFLVAGEEGCVEQALSRISHPTADRLEGRDWFQLTRRALPGPVGYASFANGRDAGKAMWQSLKEDGADIFWPLDIDLPFEPDLDLLPPFRAVEKYFHPTVSYMQVRPEGFFIEVQELMATSSAQ
jgi:hypothetical protein